MVLFTVVTLTQDVPKPLMNKTLYNKFHSWIKQMIDISEKNFEFFDVY